MKHLLRPLLGFLFHLGYFGPLVMGILDSSFLVLPFGNDLVVVGMVAQNHKGAPWYVLLAAVGSTIGVLLLALVARKLGEEGLKKVAGEKQYEKLKRRIGKRAAAAIAVAGIAPPPFPFTMVIAAAAAIDYSIWRIMAVNFIARGARFTLVAYLAIKFGPAVLHIARSPAFEWGMIVFIFLCFVATGFSVWQWLRKPRQGKKAEASAA